MRDSNGHLGKTLISWWFASLLADPFPIRSRGTRKMGSGRCSKYISLSGPARQRQASETSAWLSLTHTQRDERKCMHPVWDDWVPRQAQTGARWLGEAIPLLLHGMGHAMPGPGYHGFGGCACVLLGTLCWSRRYRWAERHTPVPWPWEDMVCEGHGWPARSLMGRRI
jgi:hypothetical protein